MGKHTMIRLVCAPFRRLQDALEPERLDARHDTISLGATFYGQSKRQLRHAVRTSVIVDRILFLVEIKYDLGYTHVSSIAGSGVSKSDPFLGERMHHGVLIRLGPGRVQFAGIVQRRVVDDGLSGRARRQQQLPDLAKGVIGDEWPRLDPNVGMLDTQFVDDPRGWLGSIAGQLRSGAIDT